MNPDEKAALEGVLKGTQTEVTLRQSQPWQYVNHWQMEDIVPLLDGADRGRSFASGKAALEAAQCLKGHRFNGHGGSTDPDISGVGNRFSARDLLESITLPSKVVSDQYQIIRAATKDDVIVGRVDRDEPDQIVIRTHGWRGQRWR